MIYVMSDLHGCYEKYLKMLEKINLKAEDILYILGDVVDRGEQGIKILQDMMQRINVFPVLGNHDYSAYTVLKYAYGEFKPSWWEEIKELWLSDGGQPTYDEFMKLRDEEKTDVLEYFEEFDLYHELEINNKKYVLVHAGIENYEKGKPLGDYDLFNFIDVRLDYNKVIDPDFYLVTGHTPTALIDSEYKGKIYFKNNHIAIDCGAVFADVLGCMCLDTMEEFYV